MKNQIYHVSTDKSKLNYDLIYTFLNKESYWAKGRSLETVKKSIDHSLCFGVYDNKGHQFGFARVVSDFAVFAWVMDVFIVSEARGKGLGKLLMEEIISYPQLRSLRRWGLATNDAHKLYAKFGFKELSNPEMFMEKIDLPA